MQGKQTNVTKVFLEKVLKYGLSSFIFTVALAVGLIIINYISAVKTPNFDVTRNKVNSLSMQTKTLLEDINFNVTIKAFYTRGSERRMRTLLEKYTAINDGLDVEFIDPLKNPLLAEQYGVTFPQTIIFETAGKKTRINPPLRGQRHEERDVTIALYRLLTDQNKTVYFTTGHGEFNIENTKQDGLSIVKDNLLEQNYLVNTVNILETGAVPEDCSILVLAGAKVPFTDAETAAVREYLDNEGSVFFAIPPGIDPNLSPVLSYYGLSFGDNYIYETSNRLTTEMYGPIAPLCSAQDSSEITEKLPNQNFIFPFVRTVDTIFKSGNISHVDLLATSENSWAESDIQSAKAVNTNQRPSRDENEKKGPLTVAVVTERTFELPDSLKTRNIQTTMARSAFFGNAAFITNAFVTSFPSNLNLFLNTVNWVTRNEKIIEIMPHIQAFTPVELRQSQRKLLTWLTLVIFPLSILAVGIVVWYRRR